MENCAVRIIRNIWEPVHKGYVWLGIHRNNKFVVSREDHPKSNLQGSSMMRLRRKVFRYGRRYGFLVGLLVSVPKVPDLFDFVLQLIG